MAGFERQSVVAVRAEEDISKAEALVELLSPGLQGTISRDSHALRMHVGSDDWSWSLWSNPTGEEVWYRAT